MATRPSCPELFEYLRVSFTTAVGIYILILLSSLSFSAKMTVLCRPWLLKVAAGAPVAEFYLEVRESRNATVGRTLFGRLGKHPLQTGTLRLLPEKRTVSLLRYKKPPNLQVTRETPSHILGKSSRRCARTCAKHAPRHHKSWPQYLHGR